MVLLVCEKRGGVSSFFFVLMRTMDFMRTHVFSRFQKIIRRNFQETHKQLSHNNLIKNTLFLGINKEKQIKISKFARFMMWRK